MVDVTVEGEITFIDGMIGDVDVSVRGGRFLPLVEMTVPVGMTVSVGMTVPIGVTV